MWNQKFSQSVYEKDPYGRFSFGYPPESSADWGWIEHMYASLKDKGRMAVVIDTGAVSRGSGTSGRNRERDIRKVFVDNDLIEAVILLPENLFYNTTAPGVIIVINKNKISDRKSQILLINISDLYEKGRPKNYLPQSTIQKVYEIYSDWKEEEGISKIISIEEAIRNDYNLSPSRYVAKNNQEEVLPLQEAIVELEEAEEERREADKRLWEILESLRLAI
ncbi:MAG: SAM-dependent methyltransferase [Leptospiraceae bacterium]|nr:SAM-dependent methyltransferase [Leptospiraceae bacterium]MDW7977123.1 N-6 DNA methylase [Leptospiraceae bacterium]